ncbi:unnamed protein product [Alternaria alternata]
MFVDFKEYKTIFSLKGVPQVNHFVDQPAEIAEIERALLPRHLQNSRQRIHVLRGLGGIGKTQLAVDEDILKRSIASCASRIPQGQIPETSRQYAADASADIDAVVKDVMA